MSLVTTEDRDAVRHVVLNRPDKRNAMNQALLGSWPTPCARRRTTLPCTAWSCAARAPCSPPAST